MKYLFFLLLIPVIALIINSCADSKEDTSGAIAQMNRTLDQPNFKDDEVNPNIPNVTIDTCYLIDNTNIDNSTIDNSTITYNSSIKNSTVKNCSTVTRSTVDNSSTIDNSSISDSTVNKSTICVKSKIDNSSIDNATVCNSSIVQGGSTIFSSTVDNSSTVNKSTVTSSIINSSVVGNGSNVCQQSTIDNATLDNATVCNSSTVQGGSTVNGGSTIQGGSTVRNSSTVCNSTVDNVTIDNATVCNSTVSNVLIANITMTESVAPTVSGGVTISGASGVQNSLLNTGDVVSVTATFSENVSVTGTPQLTLAVGSDNRIATYTSGSGGTTLVFQYTIQAGDTDSDGISIRANVLALNSGTISDASGNNATLAHSSVANNSSYMVDTTAPTTTWSAATDNVGTVTGVLSSGDTTDDTALVLSGTNEAGSSVMVYNGSTQLGAATISGTNWSYSSAVANGTTYQFNVTGTDPAGNTSAATTNFTVTGDTTAPTLAITLSDTDIKFGETSTITFNFSETPSNFAAADITVQSGSIGSTLAVNGGDNTLYTATFTPTPGANDTTNEVTVGQAWTDAAGHAPAADSRSANYIVDL